MEPHTPSTKKLLKKISRKAGVTLRDHKMVAEGDHILLGLSGGKDSMVMLEVMADRRSALPFALQLTAAHVQVTSVGYKANVAAMESLCRELDIPFLVRETELGESREKEKDTCFLCSWQRRKVLFDLSLELGANKLALGHHRYDALETLLMNMIYHGSISSLPYRLEMFEGRMELIRPLLNMDEHLLADYAAQRDFRSEGTRCNHEHNNQRVEIRELIGRIEKMHGRGAVNMFRAMDKIFADYLPQGEKKARTS